MYWKCLHDIYCCPPIGVQQLFNRNLAPGCPWHVKICVCVCVYIYNYIYIILLWFLLLLLLYIIFVSGILFFGYTDSMSGWWCDFLKYIHPVLSLSYDDRPTITFVAGRFQRSIFHMWFIEVCLYLDVRKGLVGNEQHVTQHKHW